MSHVTIFVKLCSSREFDLHC